MKMEIKFSPCCGSEDMTVIAIMAGGGHVFRCNKCGGKFEIKSHEDDED